MSKLNFSQLRRSIESLQAVPHTHRWPFIFAIIGTLGMSGCDMTEPFDEEMGESIHELAGPDGFVVVSGDDADDYGHCGGTACGGMYPALFKEAVAKSKSGGTGILAIGVNGSSALDSFNSWNSTANGGPGAPVTHLTLASDIRSKDFNKYAVIYLPSYKGQTSGGLTDDQMYAIADRKAAIADFVNNQGGSLIALTQAHAPKAWEFLPVPLTTANASFTDASPTSELTTLAPGVTPGNLSHCCFHNVFTGPSGYSGLKVFAVNNDSKNTYYGKPVVLGGTSISAEICDDNVDNDKDGDVDKDDEDCWICGDGVVDNDEDCDDGNVLDGDGCSSVCELENRAPEAACQPASECNEPGVCHASVTGLGAGSSDPDGDPISVSQSPQGPYSVGHHNVTVTVTDSYGSSDQCVASVDISDCEAPTIDCPDAFTVECMSNAQAPVTPPATGATDNCGTASVTPPSSGSYPLGSSTLTYLAEDAAGNGASCTTSVTVQDTTPPTVLCPGPTIAECTGSGQATVDPGQAQASDSCTTASANTPGPGTYPLGTTAVSYTATDQAGNVASCSSMVTVQDTTSPDISCPAPILVECTGNSSAFVTPGHAMASDICTGTDVTGPAAGYYPLGTNVVSYTATDTSGNASGCDAIIEVADQTPPVVTVTPPSVVWPPNHKYRTFDLLSDCGIAVEDQCGGVLDPSVSSPTITCVTSDEPDDARGDGRHTGDIQIVDATTVSLRAERQGMGDGRLYNIHFQVTDASGNIATGICPVAVPHDQSGAPAVDSGTSLTICRL